MEFREFKNPEERDYDISSSFDTNYSSDSVSNQYAIELADLIGILEDINEEDLQENYGISVEEYWHPDEEVIRKVTEKLNSVSVGRHR